MIEAKDSGPATEGQEAFHSRVEPTSRGSITTIQLSRDHESRQLCVVFVSHFTGQICHAPWSPKLRYTTWVLTPQETDDPSTFVPGNYRHYKGGMYTALFLSRNSVTHEVCVVYVSHTTGAVCHRPWKSPKGKTYALPDPARKTLANGVDAWCDDITQQDATQRAPEVKKRFTFVGVAK